MPVNTDRTITANRPDVIVNDSVNSTCKMIDMTIAWDTNIAPREIEKKSKYKDLKLEIQRMWQMKTEVIPVVVGALGTVKKGMVEYRVLDSKLWIRDSGFHSLADFRGP